MSASVTIAFSPKSEPGALDGFAATCSCGAVLKTSLGEHDAKVLGAKHLGWHKAKLAAGEAAARKGAKS